MYTSIQTRSFILHSLPPATAFTCIELIFTSSFFFVLRARRNLNDAENIGLIQFGGKYKKRVCTVEKRKKKNKKKEKKEKNKGKSAPRSFQSKGFPNERGVLGNFPHRIPRKTIVDFIRRVFPLFFFLLHSTAKDSGDEGNKGRDLLFLVESFESERSSSNDDDEDFTIIFIRP